MKSYQRQSSMEKHVKDDYEEETFLTGEKIKNSERSDVCREASTLLGKLSETHGAAIILSQQSFINIHDFIMRQSLLYNGHRSGVLANVTYSAFLKYRMKDGQHVIKFCKHTILGSHEPARVVLDDQIFQWLETYASRVRPIINVLPTGSDRLFLTWNGGAITSAYSIMNELMDVENIE